MLVILFLVAVLANVALFVSTYRQLLSLKEETHLAWEHIDALLTRRREIIPNLLREIKKGMSFFDEAVMDEVDIARTTAVGASVAATPETAAPLVDAEMKLTAAVTRLMAELDARRGRNSSPAVCILQHELFMTTSDVAAAGELYNASAMEYNVVQQQFPTVLLIGLAEAAPVELWQAKQGEGADRRLDSLT